MDGVVGVASGQQRAEPKPSLKRMEEFHITAKDEWSEWSFYRNPTERGRCYEMKIKEGAKYVCQSSLITDG